MSFFPPFGTPSQLYVNLYADQEWGVIPAFTRTDGDPFTPSKLEFALASPSIVYVWIWGIVGEDLGRYSYVFKRECAWMRTSAGVSSRLSPAAGENYDVNNNFPSGGGRPGITFSTASDNVGRVILNGEAGSITEWQVNYRIERMFPILV